MEYLYHYTSVQGFESIIKNQCIRMTRSDFMNDPHDCQIFFDIVERYIEQISMEEVADSLNLNHREQVLKTVKNYSVVDYLHFIIENIPIYVLSLTTEQDSLPMWNYYGGNGAQFIFNKNRLIQEISKKLCCSTFDFLVSTEIEYINPESTPTDLRLNSFSDFNVYWYVESKNAVVPYVQDLKHKAEGNLEFFVYSFVKSYLNTVSYCLDASENPRNFFSKVFCTNRDIKKKQKEDLKFKAYIDLYMLILATHFKPKSFSNEQEQRLVYFNYDLSGSVWNKEHYALSDYRFGTCLRPYVECNFSKGSQTFFDMIYGVTLSPMTPKMPFDLEAYKKVICNFINKYGGSMTLDKVSVSGHDIRW